MGAVGADKAWPTPLVLQSPRRGVGEDESTSRSWPGPLDPPTKQRRIESYQNDNKVQKSNTDAPGGHLFLCFRDETQPGGI